MSKEMWLEDPLQLDNFSEKAKANIKNKSITKNDITTNAF